MQNRKAQDVKLQDYSFVRQQSMLCDPCEKQTYRGANTARQTHGYNYIKSQPIFTIFSLEESAVNLQ